MMISRRRQAWLPTLVAGVVFALSFSFHLAGLAVLPALAQEAPAPSKVLEGSVTNSGPATSLSRDDLDTQRKIDTEDDQHDTNDTAIDTAIRAENVAHDYHLKAIEQSQAPGEVKQEAIADENERHKDAQEHFQRQQAEEDKRHDLRLEAIKAAAGKLLSGAANAVGNSLNGGGQPGGGSSSQPPASNPSSSNPANPAAGNLNPPAQNSAPPAVAQQPARPLDAVADAVNNAVRSIPNGERILQAAAEVSRAAGQAAADSITKDLQNLANITRQMAHQLRAQWTEDPYGGAKQVATVFAFEGLGAGVQGAVATRAAMKAGVPLKDALKIGGSTALKGSVLGGPNGLGALTKPGPAAFDEASNTAGANGNKLSGNVDQNGEPAGGGNAPSEPAPADEASGPGAGNEEFPPATDPVSRGMPPAVDDALKALAKKNKWTIIVRDSNPAAERWMGKQGYLPKPQGLKQKSIPYDPAKPMSEQPYAGLVRADKLSAQEQQLGYKIDPNTGLVSQDGKYFYSDIDLHGVYDSAGNDVTDQFFDELIKDPQYRDSPLQELVQHYPQDRWPLRNAPGANSGPQVGNGKTLTAYLPNSTVALDTLAQMKALYAQNKINFSWLYPTH